MSRDGLEDGGRWCCPADGFIIYGFNVEEWNGGNELVPKGLVSCLVEAVGGLVDKVLVIDFSDGGTSGAGGMVGLDRWVDGSYEGDTGDALIGGGIGGQGEMARCTIATMGVDGSGIRVQLQLGQLDGGIVGLLSVCGQRGKNGDGKECGDGVGRGGHGEQGPR